MRYPDFIRPGDTIGFAAPSFGCTTEPYKTRFEAALRIFTERGYSVKCAPSCFLDDGIGISTNPEKAAQDLTELYLDEKIACVLSVGGGELMCETIRYLDFDRLSDAKPKWFMGYSDNTNFIFPMAVRGIPMIYGPNAAGLGKVWEAPEEDAFALLEGRQSTFCGYPFVELPEDSAKRSEEPLSPYVRSAEKALRIFRPDGRGALCDVAEEDVEMTGVLLGGCLDILTLHVGTPYDKVKEFLKENGPVIWALEACDLDLFSIRRALWHLKCAGWFEKAAGFLIGRPLKSYGAAYAGMDWITAVTEELKECGVPIILDADFGHVAPAMPLVIGAKATVAAKKNELAVSFHGIPGAELERIL